MTIDLLTRTATIVTRTETTRDAYGELVKATSTSSVLCELQPIRSDEAEGGNLGITAYNLYLDGSRDLHADDAVQVDGVTYELVGDAAPRRNPRSGDTPYTHAVVKRAR